MPKVSVITPTYNRAATLPRAIESVQQQTFRDYEHIIIDDGSTDETEDIVTSIDDDRVRYVRLDENQGANAARNRGIEKATGKLISFLDSDDEYLPRRLEVTTDILEEHGEDVGGVFHSYESIEDGDVVDITNARDGRITLSDLVKENEIGGTSCTMFRSQAFDRGGLFDERFESSQDYDLYLRVLKHYDLVGVSETLSRYYKDEKSIRDDLEKVRQGQDLLAEKHSDILSSKRISQHHYNRAFAHGKRGELKIARKELRTAISIYSRDPLYYYHYTTTLGGRALFDVGIRLKNRVKMAMI